MMRRAARIVVGVLVVVGLGGPALAERRPPIALSIGSLQPSEGMPGSEVVVRGAGFAADRRSVHVSLNGQRVPVRSVTDSEIRFTVPPGASSGLVEVRMGPARATSPVPFTVIVPLRVVSFSPSEGSPGSVVTLVGEGFAVPPERNRVTLTGVPCEVTGGSATELHVRIPARVRSGVFEVEAGPGRRASVTRPFAVTGGAPPPPTATGSERPVIDRFEPPAGPPGTLVHIFGRNFTDRDEVWLSGRRLNVIESLPTRLTVDIPEGVRTGRFSIRGRFTVESRQSFDVRADVRPPMVHSFSPAEGPPGTLVTIVGERFGDRSFQNRVVLGGRPCVVRSATPTRLQVEVPAGAASGPFSVQVTGAGESTSRESFLVFEELTVASIEPVSGPVGTRLVILGGGFAPDPRGNTVTLNGRPLRVLTATASELAVEVPRGATTGPVEVTARGVRRRARDPFTVTTPPTVSRFAPASGAPGTEVTLYGANFGDTRQGLRVRLGGQECPIDAIGPTQVRVRVPDGASSGPFEVWMQGQGSVTSADRFTVFTPVAITRVSPTRGPVGTHVTISGTGFSPTLASNRVWIGGRPARVLAAGDTELRIEVPDRVRGGTIRVDVRDRGATESPSEFVVIAEPRISGFSPAGGPPGTEVVLQGDNFGTAMGDVRVSLAGTLCEVTSVGPTRIAVRVPDRAASGRFQVTVRDQGSGDSATAFEVAAPLSVAGFSPSGGGPGSEVVITGSGFSPRTRDNQAFLGAVELRVLAAAPDELRVAIPEGATTGRFRVATRGRGEALSSTAFRVQVALSVDSVEPARGQPGEEVRLLGRGFSNRGLEVLLAGRPVRHSSVSDTEIRIVLPADARTGPFVVRVPRMGEARSRTDFTVTEPPVLASMSPITGPVGTVVTLQGRGFSPNMANNRVTLGGVPLRIEAVSPTQMRVRIVAGATSGQIRVEVRDSGFADSPMPFRLTGPSTPPPPPTSLTTAPSTPPAVPSAPLTIQGFSPRSGPPTSMVQLLGDGFGASPAELRVWVGGAPARVVRLEGRMLTIEVPHGAQSGPIRVTRGASTVETSTSFSVQR